MKMKGLFMLLVGLLVLILIAVYLVNLSGFDACFDKCYPDKACYDACVGALE